MFNWYCPTCKGRLHIERVDRKGLLKKCLGRCGRIWLQTKGKMFVNIPRKPTRYEDILLPMDARCIFGAATR
jgi:hypothetical protein